MKIRIFALVVLCSLPGLARADLISDLIGEQEISPVAVDLHGPLTGAVNSNGILHLTGRSAPGSNIWGAQTYNLQTQELSSVQRFHSLIGLGSRAVAEEANILSDGTVVYLGSSHNGVNSISPTYWVANPGAPVSGWNNPQSTGRLEGMALNGTIVGSAGDPIYGSVGGSFQTLPGSPTNTVGLDISSDASFIVGDGIWQRSGNAYTQFSTFGFDLPDNGSLPMQWQAVEIDPVVGNAIFAGLYTDTSTFETVTGFWDEEGNWHGSLNGIFKDFEIWNGQLVAGVNYLDDAHLLALTDFSSLSMTEILGYNATLHENGLFVGSAGFSLTDSNGSMFTTYSTSGVPEPSSLVLAMLGMLGIGLKRFRTAS